MQDLITNINYWYPREAVIAIPVYSPSGNSTIVGVWAGSIDFNILEKELRSLSIASSSDFGGNGNNNTTRIVYLDINGQKIADSDINRSSESFANLLFFTEVHNKQLIPQSPANMNVLPPSTPVQ